MSSTITSNEVLRIRKLNLLFRTPLHPMFTLRDKFVDFCKNPYNAVFGNRHFNHVIKDLDLNIKKGERVAIVGVNGAGKTSLCRVISGMYRPNSGSIEINGNVRSIFSTSVGVMPELTGRENGHLLAQFIYPELKKKERVALVNEALEFADLGEYLDAPYRLYSKGMQTRLTLSIISAAPSELLILDEVFDGADVFFQEKVSKRVMNIIHQSGAVIFISHSAAQIEATCNRLIILDKSEIIYDGDVDAGLERYHRLYSH